MINVSIYQNFKMYIEHLIPTRLHDLIATNLLPVLFYLFIKYRRPEFY